MKIIDVNKLSEIYEFIKRIEGQDRVLSGVLREINPDNVFIGSELVSDLGKAAYSLALGGDKQLIDDFEYLLFEDGGKDGGLILYRQKEYPIKTFADLVNFWTATGAIKNE
jgi:hypothetical protein